MHAEDDDRGRRTLGDDRLCGIDSVKNRHTHVHHHDIWSERSGESHRFAPVLTFANHLKMRLTLKKSAQPGTHDDMVVGQQYPQRLHEFNSPESIEGSGSGRST